MTLHAESDAVTALGNVHDGFGRIAAAQSGTYPPTLEASGSRPRGRHAQFAQSEGYQLQYTPGPAATDGGIHTYENASARGEFRLPQFLHRQSSGVIRATSENRDANRLDPPVR